MGGAEGPDSGAIASAKRLRHGGSPGGASAAVVRLHCCRMKPGSPRTQCLHRTTWRCQPHKGRRGSGSSKKRSATPVGGVGDMVSRSGFERLSGSWRVHDGQAAQVHTGERGREEERRSGGRGDGRGLGRGAPRGQGGRRCYVGMGSQGELRRRTMLENLCCVHGRTGKKLRVEEPLIRVCLRHM